MRSNAGATLSVMKRDHRVHPQPRCPGGWAGFARSADVCGWQQEKFGLTAGTHLRQDAVSQLKKNSRCDPLTGRSVLIRYLKKSEHYKAKRDVRRKKCRNIPGLFRTEKMGDYFVVRNSLTLRLK
jgi:hypothetical protein